MPTPDAKDGWSAQAQILPYVEQANTFRHINFNLGYDDVLIDGKRVGSIKHPFYVCPSEVRDQVRIEDGVPSTYPINYGVNGGVWFVYDPTTGQGGDGVFYPKSRLSNGGIIDGLSNTICAAEVKAWTPYFRNAGQGGDLPIPTSTSAVPGLGGNFKNESGHTEWVDGRVHQSGFTSAFRPNTRIAYSQNGYNYDVDWTNMQEGKSTSVKTFAAVTSRSYHPLGVQIALMDGSTHFIRDGIELSVWRALSTRYGGERGNATQ